MSEFTIMRNGGELPMEGDSERGGKGQAPLLSGVTEYGERSRERCCGNDKCRHVTEPRGCT